MIISFIFLYFSSTQKIYWSCRTTFNRIGYQVSTHSTYDTIVNWMFCNKKLYTSKESYNYYYLQIINQMPIGGCSIYRWIEVDRIKYFQVNWMLTIEHENSINATLQISLKTIKAKISAWFPTHISKNNLKYITSIRYDKFNNSSNTIKTRILLCYITRKEF